MTICSLQTTLLYVLALKSRGYLGKISLSNVPCAISGEPLDWGVLVLTLQPDKE